MGEDTVLDLVEETIEVGLEDAEGWWMDDMAKSEDRLKALPTPEPAELRREPMSEPAGLSCRLAGGMKSDDRVSSLSLQPKRTSCRNSWTSSEMAARYSSVVCSLSIAWSLELDKGVASGSSKGS